MCNSTKKETTRDNIKSELNAILKLNKKRKAALEKMAKSIFEKDAGKEHKSLINKVSFIK